MFAASNGRKDIVDLLMSSGVDVNHKNEVQIPLYVLACNFLYFG